MSMAEVKDYTSGKVLVAIKQTLEICDSFQGSLKDSKGNTRKSVTPGPRDAYTGTWKNAD